MNRSTRRERYYIDGSNRIPRGLNARANRTRSIREVNKTRSNEVTVAIIKPNLNGLLSDGTFQDDVEILVMIDIQGCQPFGGSVRFKVDRRLWPVRKPKVHFADSLDGYSCQTIEYASIGLAIAVEVGNGNR